MRAPRDPAAARRARPGALLGAAAAIAAALGLVLGAAGATHALWNDQITADLGIIQVGPSPTPNPPSSAMCSGDAYHVNLGFTIPDWVLESDIHEHFDWWLAGQRMNEGNPNETNPNVGIGAHQAGVVGIDPAVGQYVAADVRVTVQNDPETVIAQGTVWFYRINPYQILVSCSVPLIAPDSPEAAS